MSLMELQSLARDRKKGGAKVKEATPDNKAALVFLGPWLIGIAVLTIGPLIASLYLAFTNYNLLQSPKFTGLANITRLLGDTR